MSDTFLPIWPGSSSFFPGDTPFGFYDNDSEFQRDIESTADWCARRLGYGLSDVELQDKHFFTAFEEAVNEYGNQINTFAARDNLINLIGTSTGSNVNLSQTYIQGSNGIINLAKDYGNVLGTGGTMTWYSGSITLQPNRQVYNLLVDCNLETGSFSHGNYTIRRIFHNRTPASVRQVNYDNEYSLASSEFGFNSVPNTYLMMPLHYEVMQIQAVEFNDEIRRSAYSFQITNNRLRIFPIPSSEIKLWFNYTLDAEGSAVGNDGKLNQGLSGKISDLSNIPYNRIVYNQINELGRQWIRKYTLALCKETLGYIRGKYASIPIPDGEVTLNATELLEAGKADREALVSEMKELLDQTSKQSQLERKATEAEQLNNQLKWYPLKIYVR